MVNQPDRDMKGLQMPSGRLVLPAPPNEGQYEQTTTTPIRPGLPISRQASPGHHGLFTKLFTVWRRDPIYMVLTLAIVLVVVAMVVFIAFGASTFLNNNNNNHNVASGLPAATATHAAPGSSNTPIPTSQPTVQPSPTPQPTPSPTSSLNQGPLSIQITNIPATIENGKKVEVTVSTSEPDVMVKLQVTYQVLPFSYNSSSHTTNGSGNATISWSVRVYTFQQKTQASVVAVAMDQNGQQAMSQPTLVTIDVG